MNTQQTTEPVAEATQPQSEEARYFRAIDLIASALGSALTTEEMLRLALARAIEAAGADAGSVYLPADDGNWRLTVSQNLPESLVESHKIVLSGDRTLQMILSTKEAVYFTQRLEDRPGSVPEDSRALGSQSWASVAIYALDRVCGIMGMSSARYDAFGPGELQVLRVIGQVLGLALANNVAHERAYEVMKSERQQKTAEFEAILGSMADGVLVTNREGVIIRANQAASEILGVPVDIIEGASILRAPWNRLVMAHGQKREGSAGDNPIIEILNGELESARFSIEMIVGGKDSVFSVAASAVRDNGQRKGLVAVFRDITRERDIERKKEGFLRHLSHELRGPLTVIGAASQMMGRNLARRELTQEAHHAQLINEHAARMAAMVEDLVESNRLESGEQALYEEPTDPGELVRHVLRRIKVEREPSEATHSIRITVQPNLPLVLLDKRRIDQVLTNLIANAMKYSPGGGEIKVTVGIEGEPPEWLRIAVIDTGAGVPDEEKERIFDQAYRGTIGKAISQTGLGLGLYISKLAVQAHGGQIGVDDTPGGAGSSFWFRLPVAFAGDRNSEEGSEPGRHLEK